MSKFCQGTNCTQSFDLKRKSDQERRKEGGDIKKIGNVEIFPINKFIFISYFL